MDRRTMKFVGIPLLFWVLTVVSIVVWTVWPGYVVGWDLNVYRLAMLAVRSGHDPYLACIAARKTYFDQLAIHPLAPRPFGYVYPPITLTVLRMLARTSTLAIGVTFWVVYIVSVAATLWTSTFAVREDERTVFAFITPAMVFFPGLLHSDPIFSGNVAYIFYALIFGGAVVGWRSGKWRWFYAAVLLASLVKPTFLTLLAIPLLTAADQWIPSIITAALSLCANLPQALLMPVQFNHYTMSLRSQVVYYFHDFGLHPAGILADALYNKIPYVVTFDSMYVLCALLFGGVLLHLRRCFLRGQIPLRDWIPVVLIGVTLMNPRIMQYDLLPITVPMALVVWRFFRRWFPNQRALGIGLGLSFLALNVVGNFMWMQTECLLIVSCFFAGAWTLQYDISFAAAMQGLHLEAETARRGSGSLVESGEMAGRS